MTVRRISVGERGGSAGSVALRLCIVMALCVPCLDWPAAAQAVPPGSTGVTVPGEVAIDVERPRAETDAERVLRIKGLKQQRARNEPERNNGAAYGAARLYNTDPQTLSTGVVVEGRSQSASDDRSTPVTGQVRQGR